MSADRPSSLTDLWSAYRLRLKRKHLLWLSLRSRHKLASVVDRTGDIRPDDVLAVLVVRNETLRLPYFLDYYRRLGVSHFLVVDNDSTDGSGEYLAKQPDISLWYTRASYRDARFGLNWLTWLMIRYAHGHWTLMVDADELLVYAHHESRDLQALTGWLEQQGRVTFGTLMLDLYPRGPAASVGYAPGEDPTDCLGWFDPGPYRSQRQQPRQNLWVQGGARERVFFADEPEKSPTLNKLPLVKWNRRWTFVNSCHSALPGWLNTTYDGPGGDQPSGVLLHTKFLPDVIDRAVEEKARQQHFHAPAEFDDYYDRIAAMPDLWCETSQRYRDWKQLEELGLMSSGGW